MQLRMEYDILPASDDRVQNVWLHTEQLGTVKVSAELDADGTPTVVVRMDDHINLAITSDRGDEYLVESRDQRTKTPTVR